jgi:hypothetical protein
MPHQVENDLPYSVRTNMRHNLRRVTRVHAPRQAAAEAAAPQPPLPENGGGKLLTGWLARTFIDPLCP